MLTRAALWLDDLRTTNAPRRTFSVRRRVVIGVNMLAVLGGALIVLLSELGVANLPPTGPILYTLGASVLIIAALMKRVAGAREATALFWSLCIALVLAEPYVTERASAAVFLPAGFALMLAGTRIVVVSAILPLALMIARAYPAPSPYLHPGFLVIALIMHTTLIGSHWLLAQALSTAARQARRLRAITTETNDVVVVRSRSPEGGFGETLFVSPSIERVLGYTPREYSQIDLRLLVHPDDVLELTRVEEMARAQPGATLPMEVRARHKDGRFVLIESRATNLCAHPDVEGFVMIFHDVTASHRDRDEFERALDHQAKHDSLTGLPNRRHLLEAMRRAMEEARSRAEPLSIVFCDLDHFKVVNDSLGHDAGDQLLQTTAESIMRTLAPSDSVARFGGDEFVIICRGQNVEYATLLAHRLLDAVARPNTGADAGIHVTMSMGVAEMKDHDRPEDLLRDADVAMYSSKDSGRARATRFDAAMRTRAFRRHELEQALWRALNDEEFELAYQPKVSLDGMRLLGFEALLRWRIGGGVSIGPADFVPIAEDIGAIVPIGRWVLEQACMNVRRWQKKMPGLTVAVNLSGRQLHHADIVNEVMRVIANSGVAPEAIELEMTESVIMTNAQAAIARLWELKQLGVKLAIDDFGTGYSSLSYLRKLPVDVLKIDRAFVSGLGRDAEDVEIVRLVVAMARALGLVTVAEGVESADQVRTLKELGCNIAQGFFIAKPMSTRDVDAWVEVGERSFFA